MIGTWLLTLASVLAVSAVSLVGVVALAWSAERLRRITRRLVAFAAGALLGDAFLHLLPDAIEASPSPSTVSAIVLLGIGVLLERLLRQRLYHLHPHAPVRPFVFVNLVGDAMHNFTDGMVIAASWSTGDVVLGSTTSLAVLLHEVPQELGDFGVLVHGGVPLRQALVWNLASAAAALAGAAAVLVLREQVASLPSSLLPFTAGGFVYIAASDLIPELQHGEADPRAAIGEVLWIVGGVGMMAAFLLLH
jgi:zinc and cadmium transporter